MKLILFLALLPITGCSALGTLGGSLTGHPTTVKPTKVWFKDGVSESDTALMLKKCEYHARSNTSYRNVIFTQDAVRREAELRDLCMEAEGFKAR